MIFWLWSWGDLKHLSKYPRQTQKHKNRSVFGQIFPTSAEESLHLQKSFKSQHPTNHAKHSPRTSSGHPSFPGSKMLIWWTNCWFFWHKTIEWNIILEDNQVQYADLMCSLKTKIKVKGNNINLEENLAKHTDLMPLSAENNRKKQNRHHFQR